MRFPRFAKNCADAGRASLGHLDEDAFVFVRDHVSAAGSVDDEVMGRPGLEPGTNPESFRGCSYSVRLSF